MLNAELFADYIIRHLSMEKVNLVLSQFLCLCPSHLSSGKIVHVVAASGVYAIAVFRKHLLFIAEVWLGGLKPKV